MKGLEKYLSHLASKQPPCEDWALGDMAECIISKDGWICPLMMRISVLGPKKGERMIVRQTLVIGPHIGLRFSRWRGFYNANAFRKVIPNADAATSADSAFIEQLHTKKLSSPRHLEDV